SAAPGPAAAAWAGGPGCSATAGPTRWPRRTCGAAASGRCLKWQSSACALQGLLADLVAGKLLQRTHPGRVVPGRAAARDAGGEQLLGGGGGGQRQAELARRAEGQVEVLLVQRDAKARLESALDHAVAQDVEDTRRGQAAHQRLPHLGWV